MYLEIYIDVIFIINFLMDYILLSLVMKILKWKSSFIRRIMAATIGALWACILIVISGANPFTEFVISYFFICVFMVWIAYRPKTWKMGLKSVIVLYLVTFLLGGLLNSLYYHSSIGYYFHELINGRLFAMLNIKKMVLSVILGTLVIIFLFKIIKNLRRGDVDLYEIKLYLQDKSIEVIGFLDTGNNLQDPVLGKPVIIIEYSSIIKLLSIEQIQYLDKWVKKSYDHIDINLNMSDSINVFMIPFSSIGMKKGLLPAIKINKLEILKDDEIIIKENVLTGIWNGQFSRNNKYQLILHRDVV